MREVDVTVALRPFELRLLRRALALEADKGNLDRTEALKRICQLDVLRWNAESCAEGKRSFADGGRSSPGGKRKTSSDYAFRG